MAGTDILERGPELEAIDAVAAAAREGRGRGLLLDGVAGVGKTTLLEAAMERADAAAMRVLRARGDELERGFPWGVAIQLFGAEAHGPESDRILSGPAALTRPLFERGAAGPEVSAEPFPLLHGLHWLTVNLAEAAEAPLLIVVDDAHLCDRESLGLLHYLLARVGDLGASLILAARTGDPAGPGIEPLLARIRTHPAVLARTVEPLSEASIRSFIAADLPDADDAFEETLVAAVRGNPFLYRELLATVRAEGIAPTAESAAHLGQIRPEGVRNSILVRLGRLGRDAGRLAAAAAVLGPAATPELVKDLAGVHGEAAAAALDALVEAGLLTDSRSSLAFVHPVVREIIHGDLSGPRARHAHLAAARLLHARGADAAQVCSHLAAGDPAGEPWALQSLRQAAAEDVRRGAPARAAELLRAALEEASATGERPAVLVELGRAEVAAGDPRGPDRLREALRLAPAETGALEVALALAEALYASGRFREAAEEFAAALDSLAATGSAEHDPVMEARLVAGLAAASRLAGLEPERVRRRTEALVAAPPESPTPAERVLMAMAAGEHALGVERPREQVLRLAHAALAGGHPVDALGRAVIEPVTAALMFCDEFEMADAILSGLLERAEQRGEAAGYVSLVSFRSYVALARGPLALAAAYAEDAIRVATDVPGASVQALAPARHGLARASLERGELRRAEQAVDVPDAGELWGGSPLYGWFLDAAGRVALAAGRPADALDAFRAAGECFCAAGGPGAVCDWRSGAALAAHAAGDRDTALQFADEEVSLARGFGAPRALSTALRSRALLEQRAADAVEPLREAVATVAPSEARVEHAKALVELGAALRRAGWDRDSREPLREGMEAARRCGALAVVDRAAAELEASGARRPRMALTGVESLTPSQRRVAELAVQDMSNREIAAALFVSQRTVETHLSAVYGKLDISSREELPAALAEDRR